MRVLLVGLLLFVIVHSQQQFPKCYEDVFLLDNNSTSTLEGNNWNQAIGPFCTIKAVANSLNCTSMTVTMAATIENGSLCYITPNEIGCRCQNYFNPPCNRLDILFAYSSIHATTFPCRKLLFSYFWPNQTQDYEANLANSVQNLEQARAAEAQKATNKTAKKSRKKRVSFVHLLQLYTEKNFYEQLGISLSSFIIIYSWAYVIYVTVICLWITYKLLKNSILRLYRNPSKEADFE